jgi:hypothetical protein
MNAMVVHQSGIPRVEEVAKSEKKDGRASSQVSHNRAARTGTVLKDL